MAASRRSLIPSKFINALRVSGMHFFTLPDGNVTFAFRLRASQIALSGIFKHADRRRHLPGYGSVAIMDSRHRAFIF
jgi:hypothetical protein